MGIDFLCCAHDNEQMKTHDAVCNTFATIKKKNTKIKNDYDERWKLKDDKKWVDNEVYTSLL